MTRDKQDACSLDRGFFLKSRIGEENDRFSSLEQAEAYDGSLNDLKEAMRKGGRRRSRTVNRLLKALIKAASGDGRKVLRFLIAQLHWEISEVAEWLQVEELEARRAGPRRDFFRLGKLK